MASWLMALRPSGLGNYFICKRFAAQIFLLSLEFVIQIKLEHDTIAVWNLARSWSICSYFYFSITSLPIFPWKKYWIIRTLGIRIHQISFFKQIILLQWSNYIFCIVPPCAFKNLEGRISGPLQIPSWCVSLCGNFSLCGNSYFILLISADWVRVFRTTLCSSDQRFSRNTKHPYA